MKKQWDPEVHAVANLIKALNCTKSLSMHGGGGSAVIWAACAGRIDSHREVISITYDV
jgi:hypothetical protein